MKDLTPEESKLDDDVLRYVTRPGYQPVKPRVIAKKLGLLKDRAAEVKKSIKRLVRTGRLMYGASHLVKPIASAATPPSGTTVPTTAPAANQIVGVFRRNEKGFGFVRPTAPKAAAGPSGGTTGSPSSADDTTEPADLDVPQGRPADIYVPAKHAGDAATGDLVLVGLAGRSHRFPDRGPKGHIVKILQRQRYQFVGTYFESRGAGWVRVDGPMFADPISVGDPDAGPDRVADESQAVGADRDGRVQAAGAD